MDLLGRQKELDYLENVYESQNKIAFLYGNKGLGKTAIIVEFCKNKRVVYFSAAKETKVLQIRRFKERLKKFSKKISENEEDDWNEMFTAFSEAFPGEKKILVIDNIHYLVQSFPNILQNIQICWESRIKNTDTMLLLCGDYTKILKGDDFSVIDNKRLNVPEYVSIMKIRQMRFTQIHECFPGFSFSELMRRYYVAGGSPEYFRFFYNDEPLLENISKHVLEKGAPLYDAPIAILEREVREPTYYFSILRALAKSPQKLNDIYSTLEEKANTLSPYISALINMDLILKRFPPFEKNPEKSRRGNYYIYSGFICFWFYFIYPYMDEIELGNKQEALNNISMSLFSGNYMWHMSYRIARDIFLDLCAKEKFKFAPGEGGQTGAVRIGADIALPLVSMEKGTNRMFCAFCEYNYNKPVGMGLLTQLIDTCNNVEETKGKDIIYGLFSKTGFDKELISEARETNKVLLVNEMSIVAQPE